MLDAGKIIVLGFALSVGVSYLFAWTGPTAPPPEGNVAAPVNVSSNAQAKLGGLSLGTTVLPIAPALFRVDCPSNDCIGKVLTATDNNGNATWQTPTGGGFTNFAVFDYSSGRDSNGNTLTPTSPGNYNWSVPAGVTKVMVEVWGGGGPGLYAMALGTGVTGGGGGYARGIYLVPNPQYSITIGSSGGTSSFGSLISATGGAPAYQTTGTFGWIYNGEGGIGNGLVSIQGEPGGGAPLGGYANCPGRTPGGGGSYTSGNGCSGGSGRVIVWW